MPQLLAGEPASGEECSLFAKAKSLLCSHEYLIAVCPHEQQL